MIKVPDFIIPLSTFPLLFSSTERFHYIAGSDTSNIAQKSWFPTVEPEISLSEGR
jgi:hypothetical protein